MKSARSLVWLVFALSALLAISMGIWFVVLYLGSMSQLPNTLANFGKAVAQSENLAALKAACLTLAEVSETERIGRLNFVLVSTVASVAVGLLSAAVSLRVLSLLKSEGSGN